MTITETNRTATRSGEAQFVVEGSVATTLRLDRVGGITADRINIAATDAAATCRQIDEVCEQLHALADPVADELFLLVPHLDGNRDLRRLALNVRRKTQKAAPAPVTDGDLAALSHALEEAELESDALQRWAKLIDQLEELRSRYVDEVSAGVAQATETLEQLRNDDEFITAVADASPELAAAPGKKQLTPSRHTSRSVLSYGSRAAFKTSPFGQLTTVGLVGEPVTQRQVGEISHSYAAAWLDTLARDETAAYAFEVEALNTGGLDASEQLIGVPTLTETPEFTWRRTASVAIRGDGELLKRLQQFGRVRVGNLLELIGGKDPFATYLQLLDASLLRVVAPWARGDRDALETLTNYLERLMPAHPAVHELRSILDDAEVMLGSRGGTRGKLRAALRQRAETALQRRGVSRARSRFEIYLDAAPSTSPVALDDRSVAGLDQFLRAYSTRIHRSGAYNAVVENFVTRYGTGGCTDSVWEWLLSAGSDETLQLQIHSRNETASRNVKQTPGPSMPSPSASLAVQQVAGGEGVVVINQVLAGQGGLVGRFTRLHPALRDLLRRRCSKLARGGVPFEVVPSADVNGMQAAAAGILPGLIWPTAQPVAVEDPEAIDLAALRARHDTATNSIVLEDSAGRIRTPFYLGLVPGHLGDGPERVLSVLADPWNRPRTGLPVYPVLASPNEVRSFARRQIGCVVVRRAAWTVPRAELPEYLSDQAEMLATFSRWRRQYGITDEVFVRFVRDEFDISPNARKPIWLDLRSPHSLALLYSHITEGTAGIEFTEALPASDQHPIGSDDRPRAVEHLLFVGWTPKLTSLGATHG